MLSFIYPLGPEDKKRNITENIIPLITDLPTPYIWAEGPCWCWSNGQSRSLSLLARVLPSLV